METNRRISGEPPSFERLYGSMITNDDITLRVLEALIRADGDAERGYLTAADLAEDPELVQFFATKAVQRARFVRELEERFKVLRGKRDPSAGTLAGELHRGWLELRASASPRESHAILAECERGEDLAVMAYREALGQRDLEVETRNIIQRQYEFVQASHDRVRQLRDRAAAAAAVE
jgi:uncharacterized protein (TIGR02284 family)